MKKNKPFYLAAYANWMKTKRLPHGWGLCREFEWLGAKDPFLKLVKPTYKDKMRLKKEGVSCNYWGSETDSARYGAFTPLRQTLVLLMAALNNEL